MLISFLIYPYSILINLISRIIEETRESDGERILSYIDKYSMKNNILRYGLQNNQDNEIQLWEEEIEVYENQYLLAHTIK